MFKKNVLLGLLFLMSKPLVFGQLCTGSLGDPIVNFTFGTGASVPLKAGVTNMQFSNGSCPNDGQYTLTQSTSNCFGGSWFTINHDHTGDANGLFMLVNASITPNDFYVDTISGLCTNTTFEFAAWIANVQTPGSCNGNATRPNLTFRIETLTGTVLTQYNTGDIQPNGQIQWKQYGTFFTTPVGISRVVLRITNNAPGGCGNDLALDDITFRPCGPTITTSVRNQGTANLNLCEDDQQTYQLDAGTSNGFAGSVLQWQLSTDGGQSWTDIPGAQSSTYARTPTVRGNYIYRLVMADAANFSSIQCRVASSKVTIQVNPLPVLVPKTFVLGCTRADLRLETVLAADYTYQWSGPNNFSSTVYNPLLSKVSYTDSGLYLAKITTGAGCSKNDSFLVKVFPGVIAKVSADTGICEGSSIQLQSSGGKSYQWSPASGLSDTQISNPIANPSDSIQYRVLVTNNYGCTDTARIKIAVNKNPKPDAGPDKKIFEGQSILLNGRITGAYSSFSWTPARFITAGNTLTPTVSPTDSTTYFLHVIPANALCPEITDQVFVYVYKELGIPNAFSPNGDGVHDTWFVQGLETYPESRTQVFTRSGQLVFDKKGGDFQWEGTYQGKPLPVGTYYYLINLNTGQAPLSGWLLIIR